MSSPIDPARAILDEFVTAMGAAFNPNDAVATPKGGGTSNVRVFAGEGELPASLIVNTGSGECVEPLVWVRLAQRYLARDTGFPDAFTGRLGCGEADVHPALAVEVGVGRCSTMEDDPAWDTLADEADISLDDSYRLMLGVELARVRLQGWARAFAADTVAPFGPHGGVIAWTGMAYVSYERVC